MDYDPDFVAKLRAEWQWQEDHPSAEPCPRCGKMTNHCVNIDLVLKSAVENLAAEIDRRAVEFILDHDVI